MHHVAVLDFGPLDDAGHLGDLASKEDVCGEDHAFPGQENVIGCRLSLCSPAVSISVSSYRPCATVRVFLTRALLERRISGQDSKADRWTDARSRSFPTSLSPPGGLWDGV